MGYLLGLKEYLGEAYTNSIFDQALVSKQPWEFHLHGHRTVRARVLENLTYELKVNIEGQGQEDLPKLQVKLLYPADLAESISSLIKMDKKIKALAQSPIPSPGGRYFIKNKSFFPLMKEKQVVFFYLTRRRDYQGHYCRFQQV